MTFGGLPHEAFTALGEGNNGGSGARTFAAVSYTHLHRAGFIKEVEVEERPPHVGYVLRPQDDLLLDPCPVWPGCHCRGRHHSNLTDPAQGFIQLQKSQTP